MRNRILTVILAAIILAQVIINKNAVPITIPNLSAQGENIYPLLSFLFYALNLIAVVGLLIYKNWGYIIAYIAVCFTTVMFSLPYIRFNEVHDSKQMIINNIIFVILLIVAHFNYLRRK